MATGIPRASDLKPTDIKIVLIGLKGSGKSSTGNTILAWNRFNEAPNSSSTIESEAKQIGQASVTVIDSPGLDASDTLEGFDEIIHHLRQDKNPCPCVFGFVLTANSFTDEDGETIALMTKTFGNEIMKHAIVLFTHGDALKAKDMEMKDFLQHAPEELRKLVKSCGRRVFAINNRSSDKISETKRLLSSISKWHLDQKNFEFRGLIDGDGNRNEKKKAKDNESTNERNTGDEENSENVEKTGDNEDDENEENSGEEEDGENEDNTGEEEDGENEGNTGDECDNGDEGDGESEGDKEEDSDD